MVLKQYEHGLRELEPRDVKYEEHLADLSSQIEKILDGFFAEMGGARTIKPSVSDTLGEFLPPPEDADVTRTEQPESHDTEGTASEGNLDTNGTGQTEDTNTRGTTKITDSLQPVSSIPLPFQNIEFLQIREYIHVFPAIIIVDIQSHTETIMQLTRQNKTSPAEALYNSLSENTFSKPFSRLNPKRASILD